MTEPLPPLNPDPPPKGFWDWLNRPANQNWIKIVLFGLASTVGGFWFNYKINSVHQDVQSAKDVQSKIVAVEVGKDPKAFDALQQVDANLKKDVPATDPIK